MGIKRNPGLQLGKRNGRLTADTGTPPQAYKYRLTKQADTAGNFLLFHSTLTPVGFDDDSCYPKPATTAVAYYADSSEEIPWLRTSIPTRLMVGHEQHLRS